MQAEAIGFKLWLQKKKNDQSNLIFEQCSRQTLGFQVCKFYFIRPSDCGFLVKNILGYFSLIRSHMRFPGFVLDAVIDKITCWRTCRFSGFSKFLYEFAGSRSIPKSPLKYEKLLQETKKLTQLQTRSFRSQNS